MAIDKEKIKQAIRLLLEGIGEDPDREGLRETPDRVARMWEEFENQRSFDFKTFEEFGSYNEMVLVKDISIYSLCEHHLLPFFGKAHIAYIPDGIVCGLSKLVRTLRVFALRPQVQERLTNQIADFLVQKLNPKGVAVVLEMEHMCMSMRGVMSPGHLTVTSALRGVFLSDLRTREEFLKLIDKKSL
ncbi:MAG: GTP cyclohydrolase I FolE [Aquificaceae bacterium]|nr:GTP cyclohydrolase I FolE [Aquificaceae bacterium]